MFGSEALEVGVGLIFVYLLLSLACTAATELIASLLKLRANTLRTGIARLLRDPKARGLAKDFYAHPMIQSFHMHDKGPSYIPARTFAITLVDLLAKEAEAPGRGAGGPPPAAPGRPVAHPPPAKVDPLQAAGLTPQNTDLDGVLRVLVRDAKRDAAQLEEKLEVWYNNAMDRVSGLYKRRAQTIGFVVALLITFSTNADTLQIARSLSQDPALRALVAQQAAAFTEESATLMQPAGADPSHAERAIHVREQALNQLNALGLPLGWRQGEFGEWAVRLVGREKPSPPDTTRTRLTAAVPPAGAPPLSKLAGLILTTLAVSLGSPFWFDLLNKVISIRSSGKSPDDVSKRPEAPPKRPEEVPPK